VVQAKADATGEEITSRQIKGLFETEFLGVPEGWRLLGYEPKTPFDAGIRRFCDWLAASER